MAKLLFIAIDALDAIQVDLFADQLPNLSRLRRQGYYAQFESVWPPDSETAWATIYTGWNPARHGIFQFVDPLDKTSTYLSSQRDNSVLRGRTFWDLASSAGRRVCVLFPHIGYPSWPVNGLMLTRSSLTPDLSLTPPGLASRYDLAGLSQIQGLAGRRKQEFLNAHKKLVQRQLELNLQLITEGHWDLFFSYWSALDIIQHQFWAHCDPKDPTYRRDTPYRHAVQDFYILHDWVIGKLLDAVGPDTNVIIMSDHGHGMRPVKILNLNRLLREHGLLALNHSAGDRKMRSFKRLKALVTQLIGRYDLGDLASQLLSLAPWTKEVYISGAGLDFDRTVAYITDMSGIKAYAYGGVQIAQHSLNARSYESVRGQVIDLLGAVRDPELGSRPILKWAKRREELYSGPYLAGYPDIIFELRQDYGAGWDATGPLFDLSYAHNLYPGSHIGANAVFLMLGPARQRIHRPPTCMMDICPTVLDILDVQAPGSLDGSSILA